MTTPPSHGLFARTPVLLVAVVGVFLGCVMDAMVKALGATYTVVLIACTRYVFGTVFSGAAMLAMRARLPDARRLRQHALRAIVITACAFLFFNCLVILPIAEATVLIFCAPLMIAPLAWWLLGERLRPTALLALGAGFIGVLITVHGADAEAVNLRRLEGVVSGVTAAALYALSMVLLRQLSRHDSTVTIAFLSNIFPAIYLLPFALVLGVAPAPQDLPLFVMTGLTGFVMWLVLTAAYSRAQAQNVAAAEYTALIWSALLGYFFFAETPRWQVWAGAGVVVVAVMISAWDARRRNALGLAD